MDKSYEIRPGWFLRMEKQQGGWLEFIYIWDEKRIKIRNHRDFLTGCTEIPGKFGIFEEHKFRGICTNYCNEYWNLGTKHEQMQTDINKSFNKVIRN